MKTNNNVIKPKVAYVFPGQGAQYVGMAKDFYEQSKVCKNLFDKADEILGKKISKICFEGPEENLRKTINAQSAILLSSIAAHEALREKMYFDVGYVAGHSLGEFTALYCANVLTFEESVKAVYKRSQFMEEASQKNKGTMAAVLGMKSCEIEKLIKSIKDKEVSIANYNTYDQTVITGEIDGVNEAIELLKNNGAKKVIPLNVSGGFHSSLMKSASKEFAEYLKDVKFTDATIQVISNIDAKPAILGELIKGKMPPQIHSSVMWVQTVEFMINQGIDIFIEFGPGKVLTGLIKKINSKVGLYNIYDMKSLEKTMYDLEMVGI